MPFTLAHPAIVLPFSRLAPRYFSSTALVIGSLAPDFEYFLRVQVKSIYSHTWAGIFYFDLPLALMLIFGFHLFIRQPLIAHLPFVLRQRFDGCFNFNWLKYARRHFITVLVSALIGISSHLFWDSFTHETGYFATYIPFLRSDVPVFGQDIPVHKILQHLSTLVGFFVITWFIRQLPRAPHEKLPVKVYYWPIIIFVTLLFVFLTKGDFFILGQVIVSSISGFLIGLLLSSLLVHRYYSI